jgi:glycosyltransferase involved in cell wall biosynthesis
MRIGGLIHFSVIWRSCGSEVVIHELFKAAVDAGHDVTCWVTHRDAAHSWRGTEPDETLDGVKYVRVRNSLIGEQQLKRWNPDVVVSHHQHASQAIKAARPVGARSVYLTHNSYDLNRRPLQNKPDLVIHNSQHVADTLAKFGQAREQMIFHPPLTPDRHLVEATGDALTLINLNPDKGANLFYELAQLEPNRQFVGVVGGHGQQVIRRNLPNVTILDHSPEMKRVWSKTRVLLMPSEFESYGLTAVEAGLNGIPTVAHPTPGLVENIGAGGLFADRDSVNEWRMHLDTLDDQFAYSEASAYARTRADEAMTATRHALKKWIEWVG